METNSTRPRGSSMSSADQRVTLARTYLADVARQHVDQLPPSVLARECAELRRQLGQVLAVVNGHAATLTGAQLGVVLAALNDAATFRERRAAEWCDSCENAPDGACDMHVEDLDSVGEYRQLARELGDQR